MFRLQLLFTVSSVASRQPSSEQTIDQLKHKHTSHFSSTALRSLLHLCASVGCFTSLRTPSIDMSVRVRACQSRVKWTLGLHTSLSDVVIPNRSRNQHTCIHMYSTMLTYYPRTPQASSHTMDSDNLINNLFLDLTFKIHVSLLPLSRPDVSHLCPVFSDLHV